MMIRFWTRFALIAALSLPAGTAMAQHDVGGGATGGGAAAGGDSGRSTPARRTIRRPPATRRATAPVRRGITAEQYNAQGDEFFKAANYDDALDAYQRAVASKPIASAYYHIGWIYNDRDDFDNALSALQQSVRLNPNDAVAFNELGYSYRNLKQYDQALSAYRQAISVRSDYATPYYQIGWIYNDREQF